MSAAPFHHNMDHEENKINKPSQMPSHSHNKTQRRHPHRRHHEDDNGGGGGGHNYGEDMDYASQPQKGHSQKVMSVLKTIQNLPTGADDEDELADFQPLPPPSSAGGARRMQRESYSNLGPDVQVASSFGPTSFGPKHIRDKDGDKYNETPLNMQSKYSVYSNSDYASSNPYMDVHNVSNESYKRFIPNYEEMYKKAPAPATQPHPYYNQNQSQIPSSTGDVLLDKLNYMIHLLEENQDERTNNVTEEVILYSFLGIFIIFIADSFVRVGKYTR